MPYYAMRLTPYPQTQEKDDIVRSNIPVFLKNIGSKDYLYGRETAKNMHYHIVFLVQEVIDKKLFKDVLYQDFQVPQDKIGNTTFSLEEVRDFDKATAYAVKDGDVGSSLSWIDLVKSATARSKKKKQSTKSLMEDLQSRFNQNIINERTLWLELAQGRAYLNIPHKSSTINDIVETMKINKNPDYAIELWEKEELRKTKLN